MLIGGSYVPAFKTPEEWADNCRAMRYRAVVAPIDCKSDRETRNAFRAAAMSRRLLFAEVGAWSNPLSPDDKTRRTAVEFCERQLELADELGARCCVNITGSVGEQWDGPYAANLTEDTYALIVDTTREIIDAVRPIHTFYTLETMPWAYPDDADSYLRLVKDIDRAAFGVHIDIVNTINSPKKALFSGDVIRETFRKLGPWIKSCHAKDFILSGRLTTHIEECCPGDGMLDYAAFLTEVGKLNPFMPVILEHMDERAQYEKGVAFILGAAEKVGVDADPQFRRR